MKIWVLFETENAYEAGRELHTWWSSKPSIEQVAKTLGQPFPCDTDEATIDVINVWKQQEVRIGNCHYQLFEISEGRQIIE